MDTKDQIFTKFYEKRLKSEDEETLSRFFEMSAILQVDHRMLDEHDPDDIRAVAYLAVIESN